MNIGLVGLGLIGGSMAKAIKSYTSHRLYAFDIDSQVLNAAIEENSADGVLTDECLPSCELLLLALYPQAAAEFVRKKQALIGKRATVIDLCGVKRFVHDAIAPIAGQMGFCYIGGHPMAGTEKSGYSFSCPELFRNASMILTPSADTDPQKLEAAEEFFLSLGFARIQRSTPEEHDRVIAYTSQLAHVLSSAYIKSPSVKSHKGFSAGSFKDMTRVAWLNEKMWTELFLENSDYLADEVSGLAERLMEYADAIKEHKSRELISLLREGRIRKEELET